MMIERSLILVAVAVAIGLGWALLRAWRASKLRQVEGSTLFADIAPLGRPAIVAFSTPFCSECRTKQQPALTRLAAELGEQATVRTLSALDHEPLVQQLGILTVPATVVVDAAGQVRFCNLGFTGEQQLKLQLAGVAG